MVAALRQRIAALAGADLESEKARGGNIRLCAMRWAGRQPQPRRALSLSLLERAPTALRHRDLRRLRAPHDLRKHFAAEAAGSGRYTPGAADRGASSMTRSANSPRSSPASSRTTPSVSCSRSAKRASRLSKIIRRRKHSGGHASSGSRRGSRHGRASGGRSSPPCTAKFPADW